MCDRVVLCVVRSVQTCACQRIVYTVSSSIFPSSSTIHYAFLLADVYSNISHPFHHPMRIIFGRSKDAIAYQCAKHRNTAAQIAPFKVKCAKHMFLKESIHRLDYNRMFLHAFRVKKIKDLKNINI